jgi:serine/threonine protein kinase
MTGLTGRTFSSFKLTGKLGSGAMGVVYKGVHETSGILGAVKFIDCASSFGDGEDSSALVSSRSEIITHASLA